MKYYNEEGLSKETKDQLSWVMHGKKGDTLKEAQARAAAPRKEKKHDVYWDVETHVYNSQRFLTGK